MDAARALLGVYVPGRTLWHRMGIGAKYLVFLLLAVPAFASASPVLSVALVGVCLLLTASTRAPLRLAWGLPWGAVAVFVVLGGYQVLMGQWRLAVTIVSAMLVALYASRIVLLTTPMPSLVDALVRAVGPLRRVGVDPERFGLAVAIMVRSVPFVAAAFGDVQDAARARGLERNPLALVAPVVVQTVAFARTTGEALAARGLGEASDENGLVHPSRR